MAPLQSVLFCPQCGASGAPIIGPGRGPHAAQARCAQCGRWLKWVGQAALIQKETAMPGVNWVVLLGTISKYGIEVRYAVSGTPCASFALVLGEVGQDGREHLTLIPCEVWGKKAEAASEIEAGALVLFEGKLAKRKKGELWELVVSGFELTPVLQGAAVPA